MDPDANLAEQRRLQRLILNPNLGAEAYNRYLVRLAELAEAMDGWISKGGFLPAVWKSKQWIG